MKLSKKMPIDQNSLKMEELAIKNGTTLAICGYITAAICDYLGYFEQFTPEIIKSINAETLSPYIQKAMKTIASSRRQELKKYYKLMNQADRKAYIKDWVANYQLCDYLESVAPDATNKQLFFFRQVAYDHPEELKILKWEQSERVKEQIDFKGEKYFYSAFNPYECRSRDGFADQIKRCDRNKPIIIATDVLGHYNVTVLHGGQVTVLDSLSEYLEGSCDCGIVQTIMYCYKSSYLVKEEPSQSGTVMSG